MIIQTEAWNTKSSKKSIFDKLPVCRLNVIFGKPDVPQQFNRFKNTFLLVVCYL